MQIARSFGTCSYPADCLFLAAMNPCKCGYYPDRNRCRCTQSEIHRYLSRVSGPILDRIDICVEAPRVDVEELSLRKEPCGETSAQIRERVLKARQMQKKRFAGTKLRFNADMNPSQLRKYCPLGEAQERLLNSLFHSLQLSARSYHRIIRVARTIADLDGSEQIEKKHLTEAACYRMADMRYWADREGDS